MQINKKSPVHSEIINSSAKHQQKFTHIKISKGFATTFLLIYLSNTNNVYVKLW